MFEVGQKVRVTKDLYCPTTSSWVGKVGTVINVITQGPEPPVVIVHFPLSELPNDVDFDTDARFHPDEIDFLESELTTHEAGGNDADARNPL